MRTIPQSLCITGWTSQQHGKNLRERGALTYWRALDGWHSRPGECRQMDKSGLGKNPGERGALMKSQHWKEFEGGALTSWRVQRNGLVRTRKESEGARGAHVLESAEERI